MIRTSTIVIAAGGEHSVYKSVKEVPPGLRKKLLESTQGNFSATILIADKRGREALASAIRGLPGRAPRWEQVLYERRKWLAGLSAIEALGATLGVGVLGLVAWLWA